MSALGIFCLIIISILIFRKVNQDSAQDSFEEDEKKRRAELKEIIEQREERLNFEEFDEERFWAILENLRSRGGDSYKNNLGLFRDVITKYSPEDLIKLDNLMTRLFLKGFSYDVHAAAAIIFNSSESRFILLLLNVFMWKGEVFFKQAVLNPNLIIGKRIVDVEERIIPDIIADVYFRKTRKLIPLAPEDNTAQEMLGEPWNEKELPSRYSELWMEFA